MRVLYVPEGRLTNLDDPFVIYVEEEGLWLPDAVAAYHKRDALMHAQLLGLSRLANTYRIRPSIGSTVVPLLHWM